VSSPDARSPARSTGCRLSILGVLSLSLLGLTACGDDSGSSIGAETTAVSTSDAAATSTAPPSEMGADDRIGVDAAIADGLARVTSVAPQIAPPALWVGVWDPAKGSYLTVQGDAAEGRPATLDDHFRIGSVTKTFTAAVILQLVDEGRLTLDDTVGALLPDLAARHPEITDVTVESLLNMTSRIEDYLNVPDGVVAEIAADPARVWAPDELVAAALEPGLLPPGTAGYSTTNMIILQLIAESLDGQPLADSIGERLTGPLGMDQSSLPIEDPALPEPFAAGHLNGFCIDELTKDGATGVDTATDPTGWTISYAQGGGGMTSTLADLGRWADSNSGNQFLGPELQAARLDTTTALEGAPFVYGLGIYQLGDGWYGHDGEAIGWQSIALHNPSTGVSVAMAANTCAAMSLVFDSILNELYPDPALDAFLTSQLGG
jgi:D-alanyl-D-alanine carboxypeptidase